MIGMKAWCSLGMATALVAGAAVSQADDGRTKTKTTTAQVRPTSYRTEDAPAVRVESFEPGSAKPGSTGAVSTFPTPVVGGPTFAGPSACAAPSQGFCCKFWDWITYRPLTHSAACGCPTPVCTPPVFAYFLEFCPPAANCRKPGHAAAGWADTRAAVRNTKPAAAEVEESSSLLGGLFGRNNDPRTAKATPEKPVTSVPVLHQEVVPASRKTVPEEKVEMERSQPLDGKDSSKWRGLPARR